MTSTRDRPGLLCGARVYLSGPMDFVASRADEKAHGWRHRVGDLLREFGVVVFDPWFKPEVRGLHEYGREGESTTQDRERWRFDATEEGARQRAWCVEKYWTTMHIDLRMVDTSDFVIAYCPSNLYSVGTPHEIVVAREQHKPVLMVSPPVACPALDALEQHLSGDTDGMALLEDLKRDVPIKPNERGIPSLWYMPLVGPNNFFDGFGFAPYIDRFGWKKIALDSHEESYTIRNPLLPFLERTSHTLPSKWNNALRKHVRNDDWILWELEAPRRTRA